MIKDILSFILKNLSKRLTRSFLTILSVLIGIMAIYALMSFGQGLSKYVDDTFKEMGTDKLMMMPITMGAPGSTGLFISEDDFDYVMKINGVKEGAYFITRQTEIKQDIDKKGKWFYATSMPTEPVEKRLIEDLYSIDLIAGRDLKKGDSKKAVLGYDYSIPEKIFDKPFKTGDTVYIKGVPFEIIGFYDDVGNPEDNGAAYITTDDAKELFDAEGEYDMVIFRANDGVSTSELADRIEERLRKHKGLKEGQEDFYVASFEQLLETYGTIITILNSVLVIIALISVIVAAVNISNTMYTAVLERTRDIGVMKAIGARNSFILWMFFLESGVIGLIGGILGIIFGYGLAKLGGWIAAAYGYSLLKPYFPWWLTVGSLLFAFAVGTIAGFLPARAASLHKPVDALRYE